MNCWYQRRCGAVERRREGARFVVFAQAGAVTRAVVRTLLLQRLQLQLHLTTLQGVHLLHLYPRPPYQLNLTRGESTTHCSADHDSSPASLRGHTRPQGRTGGPPECYYLRKILKTIGIS